MAATLIFMLTESTTAVTGREPRKMMTECRTNQGKARAGSLAFFNVP